MTGKLRRRKPAYAVSRGALVETVVTPPGQAHYAKLQDLEMMVVVGSQERTVEEYSRLLEQAGFRLTRVVETTEAASIIEAVAQ